MRQTLLVFTGIALVAFPASWLLSGETAVVRFRRGDSDASGSRNVSDAVKILRSVFVGPEEITCAKSADTNDDGKLSVTDAIALLDFVFRRGPRPAPPFSECGVDPTPDALTCLRYAPCEEDG